MKDHSKEAIVLRICMSPDGWAVLESYCRHSVSAFPARDDALEYALTLAQGQSQAVVEVYGEGGRLEARTEYPRLDSCKY